MSVQVSITLKQLEALFWIVQLGTFERAALKLNTTQSAISKRIQELESAVRFAIFDRSQRGARLTERGEHLLAISGEMLGLAERIGELKASQDLAPRKLTIGVTELTAMTWLPRFVAALRHQYPTVTIEPEVDMSRPLYTRLIEGAIDLIVIPDAFERSEVTAVPLKSVVNVWMAKPGLVDIDKTLHISELTRLPILSQGGSSGSGVYLNKWLRENGTVFPRAISSNSLTALLGFTVAGLGVSYVPVDCFRPMIEEGKLEVIPTTPELPPVPYVAMYRDDRPNRVTAAVAQLAAQVCDFSAMYQDGTVPVPPPSDQEALA